MNQSSNKQIMIQGLNIFYSEHGEGTPVFALHGTPGSSRTFEKLGAYLGQCGCRLVIPDRLGYENNLKIPCFIEENYISTGIYSEMIKKLCENSAYIIGYSLGCYHALKIACTYPEKVKGLILVAPYIYLKKKVKPSPIPKIARNPFAYKILNSISAVITKKLLKNHFIRTYKPDKPTGEKLKELINKYGKLDTVLSILSDKNEMIEDPLEAEKLRNVTCPCFVIAGDKDSVVDSGSQIDFLNKTLKKLIVKRYEGAGHKLFFQKYEDIAKLIINIIESKEE